MDVLLIEQIKTDLINNLTLTVSPRKRLLYLFIYYDKILNNKNQHIKDSYLPEFIEKYIKCLSFYSPMGINPVYTEKISAQISQMLKENSIALFSSQLSAEQNNLESEYRKLQSALEGNKISDSKKEGLYFPVLEQTVSDKDYTFGLLETISIQIKEEKNETKFHVSPAGKEIEERLNKQIKLSWRTALNWVKKYIHKTKPHHCVFIQFNHLYGEYVGDSLGAALTLAFIKELHIYYNSKYLIYYSGKVAITGGVDKDQNILSVSDDNIRKKTESVFYSDIDVFVVNEKEKTTAMKELKILQIKYPKRKLKIIGIEDFQDLLDRRSILEIHKQKLIVRCAKYTKKNKTSFLLLLLLLTIIFYAKLYDFNSNPKILENIDNVLIVKNKNGKELWNRITLNNETANYYHYYKPNQKIVDINNDGINEVIITPDNDEQYGNVELNQTSCLDNRGNIIWKYIFKDSIETNEMVHSKYYSSIIIDTTTIGNQKVLAMVARNEFYTSALYFLKLSTGERIGPTMWHSGHLHAGLFDDFNNDGKKEIVMLGINNFYERNVLFSVNVDEIKGQLPTESKYKFKKLPLTMVNEYILLPKSDVNDYYKLRFNTNQGILGHYNNKYFLFSLIESQPISDKVIMYKFDNNLKLLLIDPSDYFRVERDSLVAQGKLSLPYTDTREYKEILKNQIRYWDGKKFVTAEKYYKNKAAQ